MGVIARKRKRGVTYVVTFWHQGERVFERSGTDKTEAKRLEARRKREVREGTYAGPAKHAGMSTARYAKQYLEARVIRSAEDEERWLRDYVLSREWVAKLPIGDWRVRHVQRLVAELKVTIGKATGKVLSPKSVSNVYGAFRTMVQQARVDELLDVDPCVLPRGTIARKTKHARAPYPRADVRTLTTDERIDPDQRVWNAIAFFTGMRMGEVCGRRWRDWDREALPLGCLTVATQYDGQPLKTEKHQDEAPRKVPVHPELAHLLEQWWAEGFEMVYGRKPTPDDFIVPNRDGGVRSRSTAYKSWCKACDAVGVTNLSAHSTRHTFITLARRGGARPDVLERVTHNASGSIVDQYTHWEWEPLCETVIGFRCDADCDAAPETLDGKWRRRESKPERGTARSGKRPNPPATHGETASSPSTANSAAEPPSATDWAARHSDRPGLKRSPRTAEEYASGRLLLALKSARAGDESATLDHLAKAARVAPSLPVRRGAA